MFGQIDELKVSAVADISVTKVKVVPAGLGHLIYTWSGLVGKIHRADVCPSSSAVQSVRL
jgi:hypothetical protein